ncbi:DUF2336 domain-containing protein [Sneathiella sp. P13V-1]|uniref:DUF2336 domain-containing protein n=1 Tax=Sneathiella sp. P13V-1 TaxID=2697366 RepID=UPI00187B3BFA|nr:DUF2336 domain-containing protein [Sneathiella sp. P13V-1]MBE7638526.1 DUF2336 domain-containing protein [Sneathiella sp. P13V-1]
MSENGSLSPADVQRLLSDRSPEARAETVGKIASSLTDREFSSAERKEAEAIFRVLVSDAEVLVRQTLSETLKELPDLPSDIAKTLASDIADVATPMLTFSEALSDEDLMEIVSSQSESHQAAIASRAVVSEAVSDKLAESGSEEVVATLMGNEGAQISEKTFEKVLDEYGDSEKVNAPMATRKSLPITVAERLVSLVSDKLQEHLVTHHEMSPETATDLILASREKSMIGLLKEGTSSGELVRLIDQLHENGRLTSTIVLRALCMGDIDFFETALARGADISVANVHILINDQGGQGLTQLCKKCKIPEGLVEMISVALDVVRQLEYDGNPGDRARFRDQVISRVLTHFQDRFDAGNVDYLISRISKGDEGASAA